MEERMIKYNEEELGTIEEYRKIQKAKVDLHKLLRRVIKSTKIGRCYEKEIDSLGLDIGGGEIYSCLK